MAIISRTEAKAIADEAFNIADDAKIADDGDSSADRVEDVDNDDLEDLDDDDDDLDDDDDDDDDEDLDDDDDEEDAGEGDELDALIDTGATDKAAGADRGDGRDDKGKFAPKKDEAAAAKPSAGAPAPKAADGTPAAAPAAAAPAAAAPAPKWEPLKIKADKLDVDIPEAQITRAAGHTIFSVKDADANRFMNRLSRGVVAEKVWHDITQMKRELEAERTAPPRKSETEIEAEHVLEILKPQLAELLSPEQLENLELKVALAKRDYAEKYATERKTHIDGAVNKVAPEEQQQQEQEQTLKGLAAHLIAFRDHEQLRDLTDDELRKAYQELAPLQRAVYWKDGDKYVANNTYIAQRLLAIKQGRSAAATGTGAPAKANTATADATPTDSAATVKGERFNAGVDSAAKPNTTSLKANRGKKGKRSREERNTRNAERSRERQHVQSREQDAEDEWRKTTRDLMRSPTLDFPDDGSE